MKIYMEWNLTFLYKFPNIGKVSMLKAAKIYVQYETFGQKKVIEIPSR